jgi:16S rRNA (uracil1498-N3)-methyltransferase
VSRRLEPGALRGPAAVAAAAQVFVSDIDGLGLSQQDQHHLSNVLRLKAGEPVVACDGSGAWRLCRFRGARRAHDVLEADGPLQYERYPEHPVVVGFVPVKGERPELVVQKLTELGVDKIALVRSVRQVVHWEADRASRAVSKLKKVAREAAAQCRRPWLPELVGPMSLAELDDVLAPVELTLAHPGAGPPAHGISAVAVGPEGGWDDSEIATGRPVVGLGSALMRTETAAMAAGFLLCALREGILGEVPTSGVN